MRFESLDGLSPEWRYGLVGGLVSLPIAIGEILSGATAEIPGASIIVGGAVAGFLITYDGTVSAELFENAGSTGAGIRAGLLSSWPAMYIFAGKLPVTVGPELVLFGALCLVILSWLVLLSAAASYLGRRAAGHVDQIPLE